MCLKVGALFDAIYNYLFLLNKKFLTFPLLFLKKKMDAVSIAPFPDTLPIAKPLSIIHVVSLAIGAFLFYPVFLTQPKKPILLWCGVGCHVVCFFTSFFIQSDVQWVSAFMCGLVVFQLWSIQFVKQSLPEWIESSLSWIIMAMSILYLGMVSQDLTESCHGDSVQCRFPLFMGTGFFMYGSCVLLNLVSILKLPRMSTPEYYEALVLSFWGLVCLMMSGMLFIVYLLIFGIFYNTHDCNLKYRYIDSRQ